MAGRRIALISIMKAHETSGATSSHASVAEGTPTQTSRCLLFRFAAYAKYTVKVRFFSECFVGRFVS